jgi:rhomboid family GlyGly-CTERM serine protease
MQLVAVTWPTDAANATSMTTNRADATPGNAVPLLTLALIAGMICVAFAAPEPSDTFAALVLDRTQSRPWPWLTAHFLHTDIAHLGWNALALGVLGWLAEPLGRWRFALSICVGVAAVDVWFAWFDEQLRFYCGLSGALNTVLLATLYALRHSLAARWLIAVAAIVAAKVVWEGITGTALITHTRWPVAVGAHVAGYCAGVLLVLLLAWRDAVRADRCDRDPGITPTD